MLCIALRETVASVEGRVRAEIDVVVLVRVQHGFQAALGRAGNGPRRQAVILVGIVRGVHLQHPAEDAAGLIVEAKGNSRIGLQLHARIQAVQVHAGNGGLLRLIVGFPAHDGSQGGDFLGRKALGLGGSHSLRRPPGIALLEQTGEDIFHRSRPKHLVGIRDNAREKQRRIQADGIRTVRKGSHGGRIHHHLGANLAGQHAGRADGTGQGKIDGCLPAQVQHTAHVHAAAGGIYAVVARLEGFHVLEHALQAGGLLHDAALQDGLTYLGNLHPGIHVQLHLPAEVGNFAVVIHPVGDAAAHNYHGHQKARAQTQYDSFRTHGTISV